ncbi:Receptor-Type Tyrosine-Protein Phosphatase Zeta [Manis pentadactyla]|nr:Receptor-Type Tyrosine-Protein Phosphatase Zeta [Manis pentadactyla]
MKSADLDDEQAIGMRKSVLRESVAFTVPLNCTEVHVELGSPEHEACPGREKSFTKWQQEGMESEWVLDVSTVTSSAAQGPLSWADPFRRAHLTVFGNP